jgi:hypothetical protein
VARRGVRSTRAALAAAAGGAGGSGFALPDAAPHRHGTDAPVATQPDSGPCQRLTCTPTGGKYCGKIGDGCGGTMECGADCPMGLTCGGGGVKNLCGAPRDPNCKPISCEQLGGRLCGRVGDGCGGSLECGGCPGGGRLRRHHPQRLRQRQRALRGLRQPVQAAGDVRRRAGDRGTGTVFAPTPPRFGAADPLYNALVYVPNAPLAPFTAGVTCDLCGTPVSGSPLVTALTGPDGKFTLKNVPAGDNIPLVIQIGRWRREVTIPKVTACTERGLARRADPAAAQPEGGEHPPDGHRHRRLRTRSSACCARSASTRPSSRRPPAAGRVHVYRYEGARLMQPGAARRPAGGQRGHANMGRWRIRHVLLPCGRRLDEADRRTAVAARIHRKGGPPVSSPTSPTAG